MPKIKLDKLAKAYGDIKVLHDIELLMEEKEFTVLVGPSGCGKSTTLRMIAGLETVTSGEIYFNDKPVSHLEPKDRDIAMVFQDYALYPHMNVAENMSFALKLQNVPKYKRIKKVREVAEILNLSEYLNRKPGELSGGQRQRVAMGRALTRDTGTFLFDEPLSNLDAKLRSKMRAELALMRQNIQKNMIYVTHDQIEAMTLADRIVVMNDGHIQQQGTPETLFKNPANKFVAGFLGMPAMNFITVNIIGEGDDVFAVSEGFKIKLPILEELTSHHKNLILGIRPSDLYYSPNAADDESIDLTVLVSEYIGAQSVLICRSGREKITVELTSDTPISLFQTLRFAIRSEGIHLFDPQSEKNIRNFS